MSEQGWVVEVRLDEVGTELVADAAAGATTLVVDYAGEFEDVGTLDLNGSRLAYTGIVRGEEDGDTDTITLAAPLVAAAAEGDRVSIVAGGQVATECVASVTLGDGDPVDITIPFEQRPLWSLGYYTEPVPVEVSDDLMAIETVPYRLPVIDGGFVDPDTLPPSPIPVPTEPPASSPAPTALPGIDTLFVSWEPLTGEDFPVVYDVHVSTTGGGFTPSTATYVGTSSGTQFVVRSAGGVDLDPSVTYYVRLVARNDAGTAAPSVPSSGSPLPPVDLTEIEDQIEQAQATADGKIVTFWEPSPPVADGVGDVWYDTANGNLPHRWDGDEWVPLPVGNEATTPDVVAGKIVPLNAGMGMAWGVPDPAATPEAAEATLPAVADLTEWIFQTFGFYSFPYGGLTWNGSAWVLLYDFYVDPENGYPGGPRALVPVYVTEDGAEPTLGPVLDLWTARSYGGIVHLGDRYYVLGHNGSGQAAQVDQWVTVFDEEWDQVDEWPVPPTTTPVTVHDTALGTDGTDLYVVLKEHYSSAYHFSIRRYSTTGTLLGTTPFVIDSAEAPYAGLRGLAVGSFDLGASRFAVSTTEGGTGRVIMLNSAGARQTSEEFVTGTLDNYGLVWRGASFYMADRNIIRRTTASKTDRSLWVGYTWADTNPEGGTHESAVSPIAGPIEVPARWGVRMVLDPGLPDVDEAQAPDTVYVYAYDGASAPSVSQLRGPAPASFYRFDLFTSNNDGQEWHVDPVTTGTAPPTTSTFPVGASGIVESETGGLVMRGDGTGDWPHLRRVVADESGSRFAAAEHRHPGYEARLNAVEASLTFPDTGDLAASNGFTGSVRAIRHGKVVYLVGSMSNGALTGTVWTDTGIVLPAGFRPPAMVDFPISTSWASNNAFGFRLDTDGNLQCRRQSTSGLTMGLAFPFFV